MSIRRVFFFFFLLSNQVFLSVSFRSISTGTLEWIVNLEISSSISEKRQDESLCEPIMLSSFLEQ